MWLDRKGTKKLPPVLIVVPRAQQLGAQTRDHFTEEGAKKRMWIPLDSLAESRLLSGFISLPSMVSISGQDCDSEPPLGSPEQEGENRDE
jgi:hypothetical protein